jgi:hypothetical protein
MILRLDEEDALKVKRSQMMEHLPSPSTDPGGSHEDL